jgi:orotate phosphoribosyltransferase
MIDYNKISELIDRHFDGSHEDEIAENLRKYEPRLGQLARAEEQERKKILVDLIVGSSAFEIKKNNGFRLENSHPSQYYIRLLEIVEDNQGYALAELMARYIDRVDDQIDRVVGILKRGDEQQREVSEEKYHLSSIIATVLQKRSCDLIYQQVAEGNFEFWQDGRISAHKKIAIVDEVITTGTGIIQAVKHLREFHPEVIINDAFIYVSRATGQKLAVIQEELQHLDVRLHYVIDEIELIDMLCIRNYPDIHLIESQQIRSL